MNQQGKTLGTLLTGKVAPIPMEEDFTPSASLKEGIVKALKVIFKWNN